MQNHSNNNVQYLTQNFQSKSPLIQNQQQQQQQYVQITQKIPSQNTLPGSISVIQQSPQQTRVATSANNYSNLPSNTDLNQENQNLKQQINQLRQINSQLQNQKSQEQLNISSSGENKGVGELQQKTLFLIDENQKLMDYVEELEKNLKNQENNGIDSNNQNSPAKPNYDKQQQQSTEKINQDLLTDIDKLQKLIQTQEIQIHQLNRQNLESAEQKLTIQNDKERLLAELMREKQNLDLLNKDLAEFKQSSVDQFNQKQKGFMEVKKKDSDRIIFLEEKISEFIDENGKLNGMLKKRLEDIQKCQAKEENLDNMLNSLKQELAQKDLINVQYIQTIQNLEEKIDNFQEEQQEMKRKNQLIEQMENEIQQVSDCLQKQQSEQKTMQTYHLEEIKDWESRIDELRNEMVAQQKNHETRVIELEDIEKQKLKNIKQQCEDYMQEIKKQYESYSQQQEEAHQKRYDELSENYKKQIDLLTNQHQEEITELKSTLDETREEKTNTLNKIEEIKEQYENELETNEQKFNELDQRYIEASKIANEKLAPVLEEKTQYQQSIQDLEDKIREKEKNIREHQTHSLQIEQIKSKQEKYIAKLEKREKEFDQLSIQNQELLKKTAKEEKYIQKLSQEYENQKELIAKLLQENLQTKQDFRNLQIQNSEDMKFLHIEHERQQLASRRENIKEFNNMVSNFQPYPTSSASLLAERRNSSAANLHNYSKSNNLNRSEIVYTPGEMLNDYRYSNNSSLIGAPSQYGQGGPSLYVPPYGQQ